MSEASDILRSLRYLRQEVEADITVAVSHNKTDSTRHLRGMRDGVSLAIQTVEAYL